MTDAQRKANQAQIRDKRLRELEEQNKELEKRTKELENISKQYPPLILTLLKRLKRIDPWNTVAGMSDFNCSLITYFKLRQVLKFGKDNLRIANNPMHTWCEFNYDDRWWIFDPIAVKKLDLGYPVKLKKHADKPEYLGLTQYYDDIDEFIEKFDSKLNYTADEAKIASMQDEGLASVLILKYH